MQVLHISSSNFVKITRKSTVRDVLKQFLQNKQDLACVIENEKLLGIVTKYSLYRLLLESESIDVTIESVIKKDVFTLYETDDLYEAKELLIEKNIGHAVVLNKQGYVTGILDKSVLISGLITSTNNLVHRLTSLVNHLQEAVITVDLDMRVTSVNTAALSILHLDKVKIMHRLITELIPSLSDGLRNSISSEKTIIKKLYLPRTTAIASFIPIKEWSTTTGAMAVLKDITDFESVAKELESTKKIEKTLESALELAYDGVLITDTEGKITKANHSILSLFEYEFLEEIINRPIKEIIPKSLSDRLELNTPKIEGQLVQIKSKKAILSQMPIIQNGRHIGSIYKFLFKQLEEWKDLLHHMDRLEGEISYYRGELLKATSGKDHFSLFISKSEKINQLKKEAYITSQSFSNVLITGESGTGKELLADGIHQSSGRPGAFIKVNCGAIPDELLESEFFGYADGAFTGARKGGKPGKFELAERGTIFLDEIGDMPLPLQVKLLRVLQEKEFERVGDTKTTKTDVRILAATNKDLLNMVNSGLFREDLYYRLHVIQLHIPPLRERIEDIPLLCEFFLEKFTLKNFSRIKGITNDALAKLASYEWPGNIRELENVLERAFHFSASSWIDSNDIQLKTSQVHVKVKTQPKLDDSQTTSQSKIFNRKELLNEAESSAMIQALIKANGNRTKAAEVLGISRSTFYQKLKKYNIQEKLNFNIGN